MDGEVLAVTAALIGSLVLIWGIVMSLRVRAMTRAMAVASQQQFETERTNIEDLTQRVARDLKKRYPNGLPASGDTLAKALAEIYVEDTKAEITIDAKPNSAGRNDRSERTVEVQRQDGSTVALGVDPRSAESVESFLDTVRRFNGSRVLAVH